MPATAKSNTGRTRRLGGKKTGRRAKKKPSKGPSFGEWVRKYAGMVKNAPPDLSMREGFGD